jgi:hypothetical protein
MTKILHFNNQDGTFNDFTQSVLTISPEGTKVEQHLYPQTPAEDTSAPKGKEKKKGLTIGQLVLLFSELLGAGFDPTYDNQSKLASFIATVTGCSSESVRLKIIEINNMKDFTPQIKKDAELVAKLLEGYKPDLARDLRSFYVDD